MKTLHFTIIILLTSIILNSSILSQQGIQANLGSVNRPTPKFGFNATGVMPANNPLGSSGANWSQSWFVDSVISLNPEILRFPGGTNANHWDWQTGWFKPGYQPPTAPLTIRTDEFAPGLLGSNAEGLFVLNLETSTADYEMQGLRYASNLGLHPTLFALGNEHNLDGGTAYPNQDMSSMAYAQLAKTYYDSIKANFPLSKVCAVGGNTGPHPNWHSDILSLVPNMDAFAFHVYLTANNSDLVFNVNRALEIPFGSANNTLPYRYTASGMSSLPIGKEVWVTEHNLHEIQIASTPVIATTWTHALYLFGMNHFFLSQDNITVILNHSLSSTSSFYESISRIDRHITANGVAMKLMYDVARGSNTCENIIFSGNPSMTYGTTTIPKLIGWKFNHPSEEKGFICNFSKDTFKISLLSIFPNAMNFNTFSADTNFVVIGMSSLDKISGTSSDSITILPFSFTQIVSNSTNSINQIKSDDFIIYPNPSNELLNFSEYLNEFTIENNLGQEIMKGKGNFVSTSDLKNGIYFLINENSCLRFIVKH